MKRSIGATAGAFLLALFLFPSTAFSVLYIDINAPGGKRMPIAVADVALGRGDPSLSRGIPKILSDDLALTDLFDLVPSTAHIETVTGAHFSGRPLSFPGWKMIGAEAVVIGLADVRGDRLSLEMRLYDATQGTLLLGKRYTGTPNQLRSIVHRFANEIVYTFTGVRGVFGTEIAFTARSGKSRGKELYIVGMDGQDLRKVTDNRSFNLFPRWSPDGQWLAYTSFRTGTPAVYLRNVSTGAEKEVVRTGGSKAPGGFSPDGVWLYAGVSQGGNSDIYRVRVVGGAIGKGGGRVGARRLPRAVPRRAADRLRLRPRRFPANLREDDRRRGRDADLHRGRLRHVAVLVPGGRPDRIHRPVRWTVSRGDRRTRRFRVPGSHIRDGWRLRRPVLFPRWPLPGLHVQEKGLFCP